LAGEKGFIQVMPDTFKLYLDKFDYTMDDFDNWRCTLRVGIAHYKVLLDQHNGDWKKAEAQYNAGNKGDWMGRASRHVRKVAMANNQVSRYREKVSEQ
jgi:soluble lytic murein transglycosylase-like protein